MRCPRALLVLALVAVVFVGACGGDDNESAGPATPGTTVVEPDADGAAVTMQLVAFKPESVTIDVGTTVTWSQKDPGAHTVTSGTVEQGTGGVTAKPDGTFDSGDIATGDTFEFTFDRAGTYSYFCNLHPATMRGSVQVR